MKKKIIPLIMVALIVTAAIYFISTNQHKHKNNSYYIEALFNDRSKTLDCKEEVVYVNNSDAVFNNLYFHIYPNAFKTVKTSPYTEEERADLYPKGFSKGYIDIKYVKCKGKKLDWKITGNDDTILSVKLPKNLKSGGSISLEIGFKDKLPYCYSRYGYGKNTYNINNWYPIAAVYDDEGWHLEGYEKYGDPFYSDTADYTVEFKAPSKQVVACTGNLKNVKTKGKNKIWSIEAKRVRDFAIISSSKLKALSTSVGGTHINSYYMTEKYGKKCLTIGKNAVECFNTKFGKYPYKNLNIVESDFSIGGMEYPNLVMIDHNEYASDNNGNLEYIVAHEIAHQWWYGLVGNNEIADSWMDESLTEYSTLIYYENTYGKDVMKKIYIGYTLDQYKSLLSFVNNNNMRRNLNKFSGMEEYNLLIYNKGCIMFNNLRNSMGDKAFFDMLKSYFKAYEYKNAKEKNFIDKVNEFSDTDYTRKIHDWLEGKEKLKLDI